MSIITLKGIITDDGKLEVEIPDDAPRGSVEIQIRPSSTLGDLLETGEVGAWADRTDIVDSVEFAREIRRKMTKRADND